MTTASGLDGGAGPRSTDADPAQVHLYLGDGTDRALLTDWLSPRYEVSVGTPDDLPAEPAGDLWLVNRAGIDRHAERLLAVKARSDPTFFPLLLISQTNRAPPASSTDALAVVDDIVEIPVHKAVLDARLSNLLERRHASARLADRERALRETVADLGRKERAMDTAPVGITITDPDQPDNPAVYVNDAFERITGYSAGDVRGRNLRMLQGSATATGPVATLEEAIDREEPVSTTLVNYRKDGTRFWNRVDVAPVYDESDALSAYVGFQTDVTEEQIRKQRLTVLNRVLRHNLSNSLNVITGMAEMLIDEHPGEDVPGELRTIQQTAEDLIELGETAGHVDRTLEWCRTTDRTIDLGETLRTACATVAEAHPRAAVDVTITDGPWLVDGAGLGGAFAELLRNAVEHNPDPVGRVRATVGPTPGRSAHVEVRIEDDGPGIPDHIAAMLDEGTETPLTHGDGLGLWLVYWIVALLGGTVRIGDGIEGGGAVILSLPAGTTGDS